MKRNPSSAITCEQCGTAKPKSASDAVHAVTCQVCQSKTVVPNSNASKHLSSAAKATKEFARSVSTSTKSAYAHAKASPVQFNVSFIIHVRIRIHHLTRCDVMICLYLLPYQSIFLTQV